MAFLSKVPQKGPKLRDSRAIVAEVASYQAMTDTFERLKAALADRYTIEHELGAGGIVPGCCSSWRVGGGTGRT